MAKSQHISPEERKKILDQEILKHQTQGKRIESQIEFRVTLVRDKQINHVLHLILSVLTGGFWLLVWALVYFSAKDTRELLQVDEYGGIRLTPVRA
ncbi:MAG: hypothetical protein OXG78_01635 [Chloroflexi bacterium]|nr:hypothetical protein [Chloroflexota bacterium]